MSVQGLILSFCGGAFLCFLAACAVTFICNGRLPGFWRR